jgi:hypothetical protein
MEPINPASKEVLRERAIRRMKKRRSFWEHLALYVVFNGAMVVLWAIEGTHDLGFWPIYPIVIWGVFVAADAWSTFLRHDFREEKIEQEMARLQSQRGSEGPDQAGPPGTLVTMPSEAVSSPRA